MEYGSNTTVTDATTIEYVHVFRPLRVAPNLSGLLWARELQLYLDWNRPPEEKDPCDCKRCVHLREEMEDEYWNVLLCAGCQGMRMVASPCPRCDSATYQSTYPDAGKGPPTGFGPYRERSK